MHLKDFAKSTAFKSKEGKIFSTRRQYTQTSAKRQNINCSEKYPIFSGKPTYQQKLSSILKVKEKCIYQKLLSYLEKNHLHHDLQYVFLAPQSNKIY